LHGVIDRASRLNCNLASERMAFSVFAQPLPADYPDGLREPVSSRPRLSVSGWVLLALFVACLVPRGLMSLKVASVCPDGTLYIRLAQALEAGNFRAGFEEMSVNTYPVILMLLHRAGLDWETAGKLWGVLMASLTVLPLWGLARRQFDDRVALVACVFYAFHSRLIEASPELIRDPTFWFLFTLTLYLMWRAVTEVRLDLYLLSGLTFGLSFLTRFEGLFLLIPLVFWTGRRMLALAEARRRLALGLVLTVSLCPAILVMVNLLWLGDASHWELMRTRPLELVHLWLGNLVGRQPDTATGIACGFADPASRMGYGEIAWCFIHNGEGGLTPVFALLMFGGLWAWRRVWLRGDHQPLFYVSLTICAGIWIHLWCSQGTSYRYLFPIVIMGSLFAALGMLSLASRLSGVAGRLLGRSPQWQAAIAAAMLIGVSTLGTADALTSNYGFRRGEPELARWIQERYGPQPVILGSEGVTPVIGYYAQARCHAFPAATSDGIVLASMQQCHPDVILLVLSRRMQRSGWTRFKELVERIQQQGFVLVAPGSLPAGCERLLVLARTPKDSRMVQKPAAGQPGASLEAR
jgi:hypothetical protein